MRESNYNRKTGRCCGRVASALRSQLAELLGVAGDESAVHQRTHFFIEFLFPLLYGRQELLVANAARFIRGFAFARFCLAALGALPEQFAPSLFSVAAEQTVGNPTIPSPQCPPYPFDADLRLSFYEGAEPEEVAMPEPDEKRVVVECMTFDELSSGSS
jgi:hypothetical protein